MISVRELQDVGLAGTFAKIEEVPVNQKCQPEINVKDIRGFAVQSNMSSDGHFLWPLH